MTATDTEGYGVDTTPPECLAIVLDPNITPDDIINATEKGQIIPVTGHVTGEYKMGDIVTLTVNGNTFTGPVTAEGLFSINVPGSDLAADPDKTIDASVTSTDVAGNSMTATDTEDYGVDTTINLKIELDANITPDDLISAAEKNQNIPVSGTVSGEFNVGDTVTLTVNNKAFTGKVSGTDGRFTIDVAGSDLVADNDHIIDASVTSTNAVGNSMTATDTEGYGVDVTPPLAPTVTIVDDANNDGIISQTELGDQNSDLNDDELQLAVKINAADFAAGGSVSIHLDLSNEEKYTRTVKVWLDSDGEIETDDEWANDWAYDPATGTITTTQQGGLVSENAVVTATQTDVAGNVSVEASDSAEIVLPESWYFETSSTNVIAQQDFSSVDVSGGNGTSEWSSDIAIEDLNGRRGVVGDWGANDKGLINVAHGDIYGNPSYNDPSGNVIELGANGGASEIYVDMYCDSNNDISLKFDQSADQNADLTNCNVKVMLVKLDDNGNPIAGSEVTLSDTSPQGHYWQNVYQPFTVQESGNYRMIFETNQDTDNHGPLLDNIKVTETPKAPYNKGEAGSAIHIVPITAECPSGQTGAIKMSGIPAGTVVTDGTHTVTVTKDQVIDVTSWHLESLVLTSAPVGAFDILFNMTSEEPRTGDSSTLNEIIYITVFAPGTTTVDNDVDTAQHDDSVLSVASDDHHPKTEHALTADHASDPVVDVAHTANTVDPV
ncbi:MAG: Ig-like domain-containing protein, partial [Aeromonas sp.]